MIKQNIYIPEIGWSLMIFYCPKPNQSQYVLSQLFKAGCVGSNYCRATSLLKSGAFNTGLTYTNKEERQTPMVIGRSSDVAEFLNTMTHEVNHFVEHVMEYLGIEGGNEDEAYFTGELYETIFRDAVETVLPLL